MDFTNFINWIAGYLGITAAQLLFYLGLVVVISNIISKLIPDSATGILGFVRKLATVIGLYVSNRISPGVTAAEAIRQQPNQIRRAVQQEVTNRVIPHINETVAQTNPFKRDPATGQFRGRGK